MNSVKFEKYLGTELATSLLPLNTFTHSFPWQQQTASITYESDSLLLLTSDWLLRCC